LREGSGEAEQKGLPRSHFKKFIGSAAASRCCRLLTRRLTIRKRFPTINIVLFVLTALTTTAVGALYANSTFDSWILFFLRGWVFSVPLMTILLVHEMGHYLTGRRHLLDVTPPYFIPAIPPLGTFGAFIKIRSPITNRKVLVEVGASGPMAGALVAIPLLVVGLYLSEIRPQMGEAKGFAFGSSIILELLCWLRFGEFSFNSTILLHPTAMAAWFGLFVTAMNLLPIGQLDGGHVIYALFGPRRAQIISVIVFACLIPLGILLWPGWFMFGILTLFLGLRHPPPLDPYTPLDRGGRLLGWAAIVLFLLTFIPVPLNFVE
jgi:membrane-associated protease RseP (regulator of RpoE activity)